MTIASSAFRKYANKCPNKIVPTLERRPGNALNVEIGSALPRCKRRLPAQWNGNDMSARWIMSGGSPLVFGICCRSYCPLKCRRWHRGGHGVVQS